MLHILIYQEYMPGTDVGMVLILGPHHAVYINSAMRKNNFQDIENMRLSEENDALLESCNVSPADGHLTTPNADDYAQKTCNRPIFV